MGIFDFIKGNKKTKSEKTEKPSLEQKLFSEKAIKVLIPTFEKFEFKKHNIEIGKGFSTITYRKKEQYLKISSTTHPKDYPHSYWISFGEGNSEDFFEYDWNSVTLWDFQKELKPDQELSNNDFPKESELKSSLENAKTELLEFGESFLKGDLSLFYKIRKERNEKKEPYKVREINKHGKYIITDEPKSLELKKKYS
jgi:hypothetical protein